MQQRQQQNNARVGTKNGMDLGQAFTLPPFIKGQRVAGHLPQHKTKRGQSMLENTLSETGVLTLRHRRCGAPHALDLAHAHAVVLVGLCLQPLLCHHDLLRLALQAGSVRCSSTRGVSTIRASTRAHAPKVPQGDHPSSLTLPAHRYPSAAAPLRQSLALHA
eukprot:1157239-Pelagomonas_calceolata.AAC.1